MDIDDLAEAIRWQASHAEENGAPCTARVIRAFEPVAKGPSKIGRRMANWPGLSLKDAMPLRLAGGLHHLQLSGADTRLADVYSGAQTDQSAIDVLVCELVERFDDLLLPWLDGPPQTNEAGRSASIMAALMWLSGRLGPRFELNELGASAGVNTMMERYRYELGGVRAGPRDSPMLIRPEWCGGPPPDNEVSITSIQGCDVAPIDLADREAALKLKSYVWPDAAGRMARIDAAIALAERQPPDLVRQDAGDFVEDRLARDQATGVTRVFFHSIVWQYLPGETQARITAAIEAAGARASQEKPLAWIRLETNPQTFRHELRVRYWPGGEHEHLLACAHAHGAWVEWLAVSPS
ncbi:MAG: DUF2332 domain-containing protein [Erythrobacter sp.]|nr:DUF2332 domain-containing protein [Erythrobacter sp.]